MTLTLTELVRKWRKQATDSSKEREKAQNRHDIRATGVWAQEATSLRQCADQLEALVREQDGEWSKPSDLAFAYFIRRDILGTVPKEVQ